jgi:hypothetical protein
MVMGTAVWALPLRLTPELTWEGAESLRALPPVQPLHISLILEVRKKISSGSRPTR